MTGVAQGIWDFRSEYRTLSVCHRIPSPKGNAVSQRPRPSYPHRNPFNGNPIAPSIHISYAPYRQPHSLTLSLSPSRRLKESSLDVRDDALKVGRLDGGQRLSQIDSISNLIFDYLIGHHHNHDCDQLR